MRKFILLTLLAIIATCGFAQQSANKENTPQKAQTEEIAKLHTQIETLQKELTTSKEEYAKSLAHSEDHFSCYQNSVEWGVGLVTCLLAIMVGLVGFFIPYMNNRSLRSKLLRALKSVRNMRLQLHFVQEKLDEMEEIKRIVLESEEKAKKSAKEAEASKLFAEAYNEKDYNKQIELYTQVLELDPNSAAAYNNRGNAYSHLSKLDKAIEDYTKAIEIDPKCALAYCNRGVAYAEESSFDKAIEDYNKAIEDYNKAIEINPEYSDAYNGLANIYLETNKCNEALEAVKNAILYAKNNDEKKRSFDTRGEVYYAMGEYGKALVDFNEAIILDAKFWESYYKRGLTYQALSVLSETSPEKQKEYATLAKQDFKTATDNGYNPEE